MKLDRSPEWNALSPRQRERLHHYERLLAEYAPSLGLLGPEEFERVHERHIEDSLRAVACLLDADRQLVDMGSGAGLPGIPLAVARPRASIALVEPKRRRVAFLELATSELGLRNVIVVPGRVADLRERPDRADVCLARAFGSPIKTWMEARKVMREGGRVLYYAGRSWNPAAPDLPAGVRARTCAPPRGPASGPIVALFEQKPSQEHPNGPDAHT